MPNRQKQDSLYKSLAIFACSALIFTVLSMTVYAQVYNTNTYNKVTGDELEAGNWNQLSHDFLFKEPITGQENQRINDNIGINADANASYDLIGINIAASEFYGEISPANVYSGGFGDPLNPGNYTFYADLTVNTNIVAVGNITTSAGDVAGNRLCIKADCKGSWDDVSSDELWEKDSTHDFIYPENINYRVGIGTQTYDENLILNVVGTSQFEEIQMYNEDPLDPLVYPVINMNDGRITNLEKITVGTIDPLYRIDGINYSTFASAIVGGVKEEYISKAMIDKKNNLGEYEHVIDFSKVKRGSELWVWYHTVDFAKNNVEVLITPYGSFAKNYYLIEGDKLILRSDRPVEVSYRLMGKRFDWKTWPLKADDQEEAPSFIINTK
jgi:hypothetical protein